LTSVKSSISTIHSGLSCIPPRPRHWPIPTKTSSAPRPNLIHEAATDGSPPVCGVLANAVKIAVTTTMPTIQPVRNPVLVLPARFENNMRIAAMIGIGDTATTMANGKISPIAVPIDTPFGSPVTGGNVGPVLRLVTVTARTTPGNTRIG
jgi:hypothetical protein